MLKQTSNLYIYTSLLHITPSLTVSSAVNMVVSTILAFMTLRWELWADVIEHFKQRCWMLDLFYIKLIARC